MKILYIDCSMGASGDMLSGALLDLFPDRDAAVAELAAFGVPGVVYRRETLLKCGIAATHLSVTVDGSEEDRLHRGGHGGRDRHGRDHAHRSLPEVLGVVDALALSRTVREDVRRVYETLAAAESRAHGCSVGEIHFHEIGAMDAIADIAAFCHLLRRLAPDRVVASPVHVGSGTVRCAHGETPVPAPAAAFLLEGIPTYSDGAIQGELCTPTGAALLKVFAASFGPQPGMIVRSTGHGAGRKDFPRANIVRAMLGESSGSSSGDGEMFELDFNVDDMTGEELAFASGRIFSAGAKDVSIAPVVMKKGRPGHRVSVMCGFETKGAVVEAIFANTSTLGVRETQCRRYVLERRIETVELGDGLSARRKIASGYGVCRAKWEADDVEALARLKGISLSEARAQLPAAGFRRETTKGER